MAGIAAFGAAVAFNVNAGISSDAQMDVDLANVKVLEMSETSPDCTNGRTSGEREEQRVI